MRFVGLKNFRQFFKYTIDAIYNPTSVFSTTEVVLIMKYQKLFSPRRRDYYNCEKRFTVMHECPYD